jgi:hypothetical protein
MTKRERNSSAAILLALLLALGLTIAGKWKSGTSASSTSALPGARQGGVAGAEKALPSPAAGKRLRVGVYLSKMTGDRVGYSAQVTPELLPGGFDLMPILEADTKDEEGIAKLLNMWFIAKPLIDAADAEALKKLDVIVAPRIWMLPNESRVAIEAAVTNGTGLLARNGLGCMEPGSGPEVSRLSGFDESAFGYNPHPMDCEIIGAHPILGRLSGKTDQTIRITPNGTWGIPGAKTIPLIRVKDMEQFRAFYKEGDEAWTFYPLYVAELGKGRIVGCQFPAWSPMPLALMNATDSQFNIRAVQWLAHRLETPAAPATQEMKPGRGQTE